MNYRLAHVIAGFLPLKSWRREFREKYCKKQKSRTEWMLEACFEKVVKLEHENQQLLELSRGIGERLSRDEGKSGFNSFQMLCAPAVHQLKHDKIRVVFLLHNVAAVDTLLPVMRSMAQDDRYEVIPAAVDRRFPGDADFHGGDEVELYFKNQKVPVLRLYAYPDDEAVLMLRTLQPDVVFRQAPWEPDIKPIYSVTQLLFTRLVYIPYYGAHICRTMSQDTQEHLHEDQLLHRLAWKVFVDRGSLENYIRYNGMLARNLVVCDSPKYEYLSEELVRRSSKQSEKRWKKMIVWAPHHSSSSQWLGFGTFAYVWKQMLEYVRQHPAYQFVFRPHPAFRLGYVASGAVAKEEMDQFWKEWQSLPNALISGGGDYIDLFGKSDALITDGVSFLVSYLLTGKPLIWLVNEGHAPFTALGSAAAAATYQIPMRCFDELPALVDKLLEKNLDEKKMQRSHFVKDYMLTSKVPPSSFIADYIAEQVKAGK